MKIKRPLRLEVGAVTIDAGLVTGFYQHSTQPGTTFLTVMAGFHHKVDGFLYAV